MARYPIGNQDFKGMREDGYIYVDKTMYIRRLMEGGKYYFLSRPRRFGKSLFLSTLEYFFSGERALFEGLAIERYDWKWEKYPVMHLDFGISNYSSERQLDEMLDSWLRRYETTYGISRPGANLNDRFASLIREACGATGKRVVVLIDEYEKPVLDSLDDITLSDSYREKLRGFYGVLKSLDRHIKFVFITGITKIGKMSVFSALNNLDDISMDIDFGAICGITDDELTANFDEGIASLAERLGSTRKETVEALKRYYDGYHFNEECPDIYNPFSIVSALSKGSIRPYWFATGTPIMLAKLLLEKNYSVEGLEGSTASQARLMDIGNRFDDPVSLFYQTGYLTIKGYNKVLKRYTLGFPNEEVEVAFSDFLMPYYIDKKSKPADSFAADFIEGIHEGKPDYAMKALEAFSAGVNYNIVPEAEVERHFQNMIYLFTRMILPYTTLVKTEDHTSDGRIDLVIMTENYAYIFEFKRDQNAEVALRQIEEKGYARQFASDSRTTFLIGVNFSTRYRRIESFAVKQAEL